MCYSPIFISRGVLLCEVLDSIIFVSSSSKYNLFRTKISSAYSISSLTENKGIPGVSENQLVNSPNFYPATDNNKI